MKPCSGRNCPSITSPSHHTKISFELCVVKMSFSLLVYVFLLPLARNTVSAAVILSPHNITVLLGQNGTFRCVTTGDVAVWSVNGVTINTRIFIRKEERVEEYAEQNIFFSNITESGNNYTSMVTFTGTASNNNTAVRCSVTPATGSITFTDHLALLRVLGPPDPVSKVNVSEQSMNEVLLSWSPSYSSLPVNYYLLTLKDDNGTVILSKNTSSMSLHYIIRSRFCSILEIEICASNDAGKSNLSNFTNSMFTKPDIAAVASSLQHMITFEYGKLLCSIEFEPVTSCLAYPVTHYKIFLKEGNGSFRLLGSSQEPRFHINSSSIRENLRYSYRVRVVNSIGIGSDTESTDFSTTDVQSAMALVTPNAVTVTCIFITGSQTRGCHVKLNNKNLSMNIERTIGRNSVRKEFPIIEVLPEEILVFDWERDGSIGSVSVPVEVIISSTVEPAGNGKARPDPAGVPMVLGIAAGGVLLVILIIGTCTCTAILCKGRKKGTSRDRYNESQQQEYSPSPYEVCCGTTVANRRTEKALEPGPPSPNECLYSKISETSSNNATYNHLNYPLVSINPSQQIQQYSHIGKESAYEVLEKLGKHNGSLPKAPPPPPPLPPPRNSAHQAQQLAQANVSSRILMHRQTPSFVTTLV